jgi:hypothetical protein
MEDPIVKKVFVLGFPLGIRIPRNLSLLKKKPVIPKPHAVGRIYKNIYMT